MVKYRKAYYKIEKALTGGAYRIILLMGLRKVGKTAILKQLAGKYGGHYVDFRVSNNPERDFLDILKREEKLILLDEIGYLPGFDACLESAADEIFKADKKVVLTGSSYGALKQLGCEKLSGRSEKIEMFPLDFEEYLYFSGRISGYGRIVSLRLRMCIITTGLKVLSTICGLFLTAIIWEKLSAVSKLPTPITGTLFGMYF